MYVGIKNMLVQNDVLDTVMYQLAKAPLYNENDVINFFILI